MKKFFVLILFTLFSISVFAAPFSLKKGGQNVVASVTVGKKTENITQVELNKKIAEYKAAGIDQTSDEILDIVINDKVFMLSAERDNVFVSDDEVNERIKYLKQQLEASYGEAITDEEFNEYLSENLSEGKTINDYKEALKNSLLVDKYLRAKKGDKLDITAVVKDEEVKKFYRKNQTQFINPEYVKVSHIYIPNTDNDAKTTLEKVLADIKAGKITFEKAVTQYSKDESSKKTGGDIGNVTAANADVLGEEFIDIMLDLDVGDIADEVVESPTGFHIIKCMFHEYQKFLSIDDPVSPDNTTTVREYIRAYLENQKTQEEYARITNEFVAELKKDARIIYTDKKKNA